MGAHAELAPRSTEPDGVGGAVENSPFWSGPIGSVPAIGDFCTVRECGKARQPMLVVFTKSDSFVRPAGWMED